jgi:hypothetical protein
MLLEGIKLMLPIVGSEGTLDGVDVSVSGRGTDLVIKEHSAEYEADLSLNLNHSSL